MTAHELIIVCSVIAIIAAVGAIFCAIMAIIEMNSFLRRRDKIYYGDGEN